MGASLATATLNQAGRRVVERIVELAREEFRDALVSVWLFGSRAIEELLCA